jgi:hypothetical protein
MNRKGTVEVEDLRDPQAFSARDIRGLGDEIVG